MSKIYRLKSVFHQKIWGTEDWIVAAHENGDNDIADENIKLSKFIEKNYEEFGLKKGEKFPLLVKIIDAKDDLSVQVHPNDEYAKKHENSLGKTEVWYVLDTVDNNNIIIGNNSKFKNDLATFDKNIFNEISVKKDDFFYIPAGTIHAIKSGTKILEVQQNSDITYRLYDYDRVDEKGNKRELHIKKALDVIDSNNDSYHITGQTKDENLLLTENKYFSMKRIVVKDDYNIDFSNKFKIIFVLEGSLRINDELFKEYECCLISINTEINIKGNGIIIEVTNK